MPTHNIKEEKTFVMIKPDGVKRSMIGEIIRRIEQRGLKVIALEMDHASRAKFDGHYPSDIKWITRVGEKTMQTYEKYGFNAIEEVGTDDKEKIGRMVRDWLLDFMASGPVIKMVIEGVHAVDMVRKLVGPTIPAFAEMGTIRGDFSVDSAASANKEKRAIYNLIHASETPEEAAHEIGYWFDKKQIHPYQHVADMVYSVK
ncbi:MAG: nucleoside-diphosphate kinase [Parcubacteria group bacterium Gr01-1014_18]|nr:MAG: nucleoside-diphosphate kinase [Parcubacteria group bacterium Greene0416_36]TSC81303.1 MAG: nucleoside-diphosphate kinase [Parcubacteria group bacterium Gr01-1014_18]TSC99325.1 MAG: nucleoside-diphosphate kinase [Parcubacteria group bacterium Greene1014_20]TSD06838.1 MAG: nucleoside-diphosphate kinase [Parcubacteria group bacterium Greene0714_2]